VVHRDLKVEEPEKGTLLLSWAGKDREISRLELQAVDAKGAVQSSKVLHVAPFRGLLPVAPDTQAVVIVVEYPSGVAATLRLPLEALRDRIREAEKPESSRDG
jgi:hypothetical protein